MEALSCARVAVFGIGGVGGYAAEALARCGIGAIDLVDHDQVGLTNLNRQIIATQSNIGYDKVAVMAQRIADINPHCRVTPRKSFYLPDTADQFDFSEYDYIIDAVDTVTAKLRLIQEADKRGTPIVSCMGTANKLDPTAFEVADIYETSICPLAKIIRKECRKRGVRALKVVYSKEPARRPAEPFSPDCPDDQTAMAPTVFEGLPPGRRDLPGSVSFVPPVAGFIAAGVVVNDLLASKGLL